MHAQPENSFIDSYMNGIERPEVVLNTASQSVFEPGKFSSKAMIDLIMDPFTALKPLPVTDYEKYTLIATHLYQKLQEKETSIISPVIQRDISIFGNATNRQYSLVTRVLNPLTVCGDVFSKFTAANPLDNVEKLYARQTIIRMLSEHDDMLQSIEQALQDFAQYESLVADFWKNESNVNFHKMLLGRIYISNAYPFLGFMDRFNFLNNCGYLYDIASIPFKFAGLEPVTSISGFTTRQMMTFNFKEMIIGLPEHIKNTYLGKCMTVGGGMFVIKNLLTPSVFVEDIWPKGVFDSNKALTYAGFVVWQAYMAWSISKDLAHQKKIYNLLHEKMNKVAVMVRAMKKFHTYLEMYPELAQNLEYGYIFNNYFGKNATISPKLKQLFELLETGTFNSSTMWSMRGRVKTAYRLFEEVKAELVDGFIAIGEMDTYAAVARAYKQSQGTDRPLTFAHYITDSATPVVKVTNMWNPLVVNDVIVRNSVTLGADGCPKNVVLTGPNAGGKTTFLKGILIDIIFAQTFGIAPAQSLECTLFSKINAYLSIVDNIAKDQSLFEAELGRIEELLKGIKETGLQGNFTLSIIDELLSGTTANEGKAASYSIAKRIGEIDTSITIISTHFVDVMSKLEPNTTLYKNYKVEAVVKADGSIYYPYIVIPGISTINVVGAMLKNAGFDSQIMEDFKTQLAQA